MVELVELPKFQDQPMTPGPLASVKVTIPGAQPPSGVNVKSAVCAIVGTQQIRNVRQYAKNRNNIFIVRRESGVRTPQHKLHLPQYGKITNLSDCGHIPVTI